MLACWWEAREGLHNACWWWWWVKHWPLDAARKPNLPLRVLQWRRQPTTTTHHAGCEWKFSPANRLIDWLRVDVHGGVQQKPSLAPANPSVSHHSHSAATGWDESSANTPHRCVTTAMAEGGRVSTALSWKIPRRTHCWLRMDVSLGTPHCSWLGTARQIPLLADNGRVSHSSKLEEPCKPHYQLQMDVVPAALSCRSPTNPHYWLRMPPHLTPLLNNQPYTLH